MEKYAKLRAAEANPVNLRNALKMLRDRVAQKTQDDGAGGLLRMFRSLGMPTYSRLPQVRRCGGGRSQWSAITPPGEVWGCVPGRTVLVGVVTTLSSPPGQLGRNPCV